DLEDALDHLARIVPVDRVTTVITPNVDQTLLLERDPALARAYEQSDLLLVDGAPVVMLGRMLGARRLHRVTGADLLPAVAGRAARAGWRIVVTGGRHDVTELAAERLSARYGADVVAVPF